MYVAAACHSIVQSSVEFGRIGVIMQGEAPGRRLVEGDVHHIVLTISFAGVR